MELPESSCIVEVVLLTGVVFCEALCFKVLQLVATQARTIMNKRFFNILSTFMDIGTGKGK